LKRLKWLAALAGIGAGGAAPAAEPPTAPAPDQAVIVRFNYGSTDLTRLFELETQLEAAISKANAGEYDGNEVAVDGSDGILYMYGPHADRLFQAIKPVLESAPLMKGAKVTIRYGPAAEGVRENIVTIAT